MKENHNGDPPRKTWKPKPPNTKCPHCAQSIDDAVLNAILKLNFARFAMIKKTRGW